MARISPPAESGHGGARRLVAAPHRDGDRDGQVLRGRLREQPKLPLREREAARWTIALINDCVVCQDTRAKDAAAHAVDEGFYAEVASWATTDALTEREKLAAEFAQRFALDHQAMDDAFWDRLRGAFADDEVADLIICCGMFLGLGRAMAVVGVPAPDERILV